MVDVSDQPNSTARTVRGAVSRTARRPLGNEKDTAQSRSFPDRLTSIDAYRGFAILYSIAAVPLVPALLKIHDNWLANACAKQLAHSTWHGMTVNDFGFPGFLMIMGVSLALSLERQKMRGLPRGALAMGLASRSTLLFAVGVIYSGGLAHPWPDVPIAGPLQRLAVCCLCTGCLSLFLGARGLAVAAAGLLAAYGLAMHFVTLVGSGGGDYSMGANLAVYIDCKLLPGRKMYGTWDPNGVATTAPAIALCTFGALIGRLLLSRQVDGLLRNILFIGIGAACVGLGYQLTWFVPLNHLLWTSSFVLLCAGWPILSLPLVHQVIDVWKYQKWAFPLVVAGRNALFGFAVIACLPLDGLALRLAGGDVAALFGQFDQLFLVGVQLILGWMILYWMYRRQIFVRL